MGHKHEPLHQNHSPVALEPMKEGKPLGRLFSYYLDRQRLGDGAGPADAPGDRLRHPGLLSILVQSLGHNITFCGRGAVGFSADWETCPLEIPLIDE